MSVRHDLKTASYSGQRDGVMVGRGADRFDIWNNRQMILHWRDEREVECCTYVSHLRRRSEGDKLTPEACSIDETTLWFQVNVRNNSNTRERWDPNKIIGRN